MYFTNRVIDFKLDNDNILLVNTLSSAMDIVDMDTFETIKKMKNGREYSNDNNDLLNSLKQRGYAFNDESEETLYIEKFSRIHENAVQKNMVKNFTICPTMGCNLRCVYCFEGEGNHCNYNVLTEGQLNTILKYIGSCVENDENPVNSVRAVISLYGGEPLLPANRLIVEKTLKFAEEKNIEVRIITNGTTINLYSDLLKKYNNVIIQITLDGDKEVHDTRRITANQKGTFDKIVSSIDQLVSLGIKTHLRTNINQDNIDSLPGLIAFIKEKEWVQTGLVYPYVAPVLDYCDGEDNSMSESELYMKVLKIEPDLGSERSTIKMIMSPCINYLHTFFNPESKMKPWKLSYCEATSGSNIVFSPDGNISTCLMLAGKCKHQIGTFNETEVCIDENYNDIWIRRNIFRIPKCQRCKYGLICGGGCPMAALNINGDIDCPVCSDIEDTIKVFIDTKKDEILQRL